MFPKGSGRDNANQTRDSDLATARMSDRQQTTGTLRSAKSPTLQLTTPDERMRLTRSATSGGAEAAAGTRTASAVTDTSSNATTTTTTGTTTAGSVSSSGSAATMMEKSNERHTTERTSESRPPAPLPANAHLVTTVTVPSKEKRITAMIPKANEAEDVKLTLCYTEERVLAAGNRIFGGVVTVGKISMDNTTVAIKRVQVKKGFKHREMQIMRQLYHPNIVKLLYYHYQKDSVSNKLYLSLIMEYFPETVFRFAKQNLRYTKPEKERERNSIYIKLIMYQLFRALNYMHDSNFCHRDVKPQNLLIDAKSGVVKLCDFGTSKLLVKGEPSVSYITSRYYRAPELIFGATDYTTKVDVWSAGTVMAELYYGAVFFPGENHTDQLIEIIKVLGPPSKQDVAKMNANYTDQLNFPPELHAMKWTDIMPQIKPDASSLLTELLRYAPDKRSTAKAATASSYFKCLFEPGTRLPNGARMPFLDRDIESTHSSRTAVDI